MAKLNFFSNNRTRFKCMQSFAKANKIPKIVTKNNCPELPINRTIANYIFATSSILIRWMKLPRKLNNCIPKDIISYVTLIRISVFLFDEECSMDK